MICCRFGVRQAFPDPTSGVDVQDVESIRYIELVVGHPVMALKSTSSPIQIGFSVAESGANTFTQGRVDLQLNPLDQEVFVVTAINMDVSPPDALAATNTFTTASLTVDSRTALGNLADANTLSVGQLSIMAAGFVDGGVGFQQQSLETPPAMLEYIGIIATNDFFIQVQGTGNGLAKGVSGKVFGYRARADAATYAALVQSEVLSA